MNSTKRSQNTTKYSATHLPRGVRKKTRKSLSLETKLDVLRRFDAGQRAAEIGRQLDLPATSVRTIRTNGSKIRRQAKKLTGGTNTATTTSSVAMVRQSPLEKMESMLVEWIEEKQKQKLALTGQDIQGKARELYECLQEDDDNIKPFTATSGWLQRFQHRYHYLTLKITNTNLQTQQTPSMNSYNSTFDTSASIGTFKETLQSLVGPGGVYSARQVFNLTDTVLHWKRLPERTKISLVEKTAPGFKAAKDMVSLLLGANAEGDYRFKPLVVYHSENPRALKGYTKSKLPVTWRSNKKSWITKTLFEEWITEVATPALKQYCLREKIPFKILMILDNSNSDNPCDLEHLSKHIKFLFMPPFSATQLQPMTQGVITAFKSYYLRRTVAQLVQAENYDIWWKKYNISKAIDNIADAWNEITSIGLNAAWRNLWPSTIYDISPTSPSHVDDTTAILQEVAALAKHARLAGLEYGDCLAIVQDMRSKVMLNNEDRIELGQSRIKEEMKDGMMCGEEEMEFYEEEDDEENDDDDGNWGKTRPKHLTVKLLAEFLQTIEMAMSIVHEADPNRERSSRAAKDVHNVIGCYWELYAEKKKIARDEKTTPMDHFLEQ